MYGHMLHKMKQSKCDSTDAATRKMAWIAEKYKMHTGAGVYSPVTQIGSDFPDRRLNAFESLCENLFAKQAMFYLNALEEAGHEPGSAQELKNITRNLDSGHPVWGIDSVCSRILAFTEKLGNLTSHTALLLKDTVDIAYLKAAFRFGGDLPEVCAHTRVKAMAMLSPQ